MALIEFQGFVGPSNSGQSTLVDAERTVNLYPETVDGGGTPKARINFYPTPGASVYCTLPKTVLYGLITVQYTTSRVFALAGDGLGLPHLYEIAGGGYTDYGVLPGTELVLSTSYQMSWNGTQLFIIGFAGPGSPGGAISGTPATCAAWCWFPRVALPGYTYDVVHVPYTQMRPTSCAVIDGYMAVTNGPTGDVSVGPLANTIATSNFMDVTTWNSLAFGTASNEPDILIAVAQDHQQLFALGANRTTILYDAGSAPFPLAIYPGAVLEVGCVSPLAVVQMDNGLFWMGRDPRGQLVAYRNESYSPRRVSTFAVEWNWQQYATTSDVTSYAMQMNGHTWWVISFPTQDTTWVYDVSTNSWFEWLRWDGTAYHAALAKYHAFHPTTGLHLVGGGDSTGNIYQLSSTTSTDNGNAIQRLRCAPHFSDKGRTLFYNSFQLDLQVGNAQSLGRAAQVFLSWSNDGGRTFNSPLALNAGTPGQYTARARAIRLGRARDRVYQVTMVDPVPAVWIAAWLDVVEGRN